MSQTVPFMTHLSLQHNLEFKACHFKAKGKEVTKDCCQNTNEKMELKFVGPENPLNLSFAVLGNLRMQVGSRGQR